MLDGALLLLDPGLPDLWPEPQAADVLPVKRLFALERPTAIWAQRYSRRDRKEADFAESLAFLERANWWVNFKVGILVSVVGLSYLIFFGLFFWFISWIE